ncbi:UPF0488 protein CG14286 [Bombus terrestris]|uniref:UPF0488 protein CG14286 n=1 Tax=Bombus terrestris TaxID=30195 RepID=A0A9B0BPS5_BOMTE|nr:UPF0488 protein CG14286 [Bombus terrestris]
MPPKPRTNAKKPTANKKNAEPKLADSASVGAETNSGLSQEAEDQFEVELCWCIQQLEMCLGTGKLPERQAHDLNKNINILKSNTAPLIRKRQIMRNTLGNYREKMALDEQKFGKTASSIKFISPPSENRKCVFVRKAASASTKEKQAVTHPLNFSEKCINIDNVQNVFRFNFEVKE